MLWAWTTRCQDGFAKHLFEALRFCKKSFDRNFSFIAVVLAWKPHLLLDPPRISLKQTTPVGWGSDWSSLQCWRAIAIRDNNYAPFSCFMLWALTTGCPNWYATRILEALRFCTTSFHRNYSWCCWYCCLKASTENSRCWQAQYVVNARKSNMNSFRQICFHSNGIAICLSTRCFKFCIPKRYA